MKTVLALFAAAMLARAGADLDMAKAERDPEKRSQRALDVAEQTLKTARDQYSAGEYRKALENVATVQAAVELAQESLNESGKNPRRSKYFKRSELRMRELGRHLDEFAREAAIDDRPPIQKASERTHAIRDEILSGILEKNK